MTRLFLVFFVFILFKTTVAQHEAIGVRIGSPTGISYKKYLANSTAALEFGLGAQPRGAQQQYYRNSFEKDNDFEGDDYVNHSVENNLFIQARFLKHYPLHVEDVEGTFEWYWGMGALLKIAKVDYWYTASGAPGIQESSNVTDFNTGPEVPLGIEYTFDDIPLTLFGETSLFLEIVNRPGIPALYGGVGLRYNFFGGKM
jgi:hypothetical protein